MRHINKLSLWKKLKRLLAASAPPAVVNAVVDLNKAKNTRSKPAPADVIDNSNANPDIDTDKQDKTTAVKADTADILGNNDATDKEPQKKEASVSTFQSEEFQGMDSQDNDDTPITDYLKQYLHDKQWHYTYYRPKSSDSQQSHHLSLRMKNKQIDCGYLFRIQEGNSLLAIYGILPFLIPESHQSAAVLILTQINYDLLIGNLEMDVNDGEIRYKNAIDVEAVGMDEDIIEHLLQSVIAMTTAAYEIFSDLIDTQEPAQDMPTLLGELRQQADERTFFLPTPLVQ